MRTLDKLIMGGTPSVSVVGEEVKSEPFVNESDLGDSGDGTPQSSANIFDKNVLFDFFKRSPEAIGPVSTIVTDILSDGYRIVEPFGGKLPGARRKKVERFNRKNHIYSLKEALLYDALITGECFIHVKEITNKQVRLILDKVVDSFPEGRNKGLITERAMQTIDEDKPSKKSLNHLPSSTVTIRHKKNGDVIEYVQKVGGIKKKFKPKEIIHFKFMNLDGKVSGFTPLSSMISELSMVMSIKDYSGHYFSNAGFPDYLFVLRDEHPDSVNVKNLRRQLKKFKKLNNKHRSLVFTGDVDATPIGRFDKDMEFQKLLSEMSRIVTIPWGVPPAKMGQTLESGGAYDSGLATEGYYRRISHYQMWFYGVLNEQFYEPVFGVNLEPNKAYLQDEVRETQTLKQKADICEQLLGLNLVNRDYCFNMLNISDEFKGEEEKVEPEPTGQLNRGLLKNKDVEKDVSEEEIDKMRSDTQKEHQEGVKTILEGGHWTKAEADAIRFNDKL